VSNPVATDRLQPALLDRLMDDSPQAGPEARADRYITKSRLRRAVLRDLAWLFNATRIDGVVDMTRTPHARRSVLNFGLPAFSGTWASSLSTSDLERAIRQAIVDFEPRILPETLEVRALAERERLDHHNVIGVEIRGHLWAQPAPVDLMVRTEIDLETGKVEIADLLPASSRGDDAGW
jgi:type VI secretion system protein ImpF